MSNSYKNLTNQVFVPVNPDVISEMGDGVATAIEKLSDKDHDLVMKFLEELGVVITDHTVELSGKDIWGMRALTKKLIATNDLEEILRDRGEDLEDDEIADIVDEAATFPEYGRHVHPVSALTRALENFLADKDDYFDEDDDEEDDEDDEDEDDDEESSKLVFIIHHV